MRPTRPVHALVLAVLAVLAPPPAQAASRAVPGALAMGYGLGAASYHAWDFSGSGPTTVSDLATTTVTTVVTPITLTKSGTVTFGSAGILAGDARTCVSLASGASFSGSGGGGGGTNNPECDWRTDTKNSAVFVVLPDWTQTGFRWLASKQESGTQRGVEIGLVRGADVGGRPAWAVWSAFRETSTKYVYCQSSPIVIPATQTDRPLVIVVNYVPVISDDGGSTVRLGTGFEIIANQASVGRTNNLVNGVPSVTTAIAGPMLVGAVPGSANYVGKIQFVGWYANTKRPVPRDAAMALHTAVSKTPPAFMEGAPSTWLGGGLTVPRVIIFTDLAEDPGDPIALWQALSYHCQGLIKILAIENCYGGANTTGIARAILQEAQCLSIPIYHYKGDVTGLPTASSYIGVNAAPYNTGPTLDSAYPDSKTALHALLTAYDQTAEGKVVLTTWGYVRGLTTFLNYSTGGVSGADLVAAKVAGILTVAGAFDPTDDLTAAGPYSASVGYFMRDPWLGWSVQGTIPSEFGVNDIEWNVQHDAQAYSDLYTILASPPISGSIPWVWHHMRPSVLLTGVNANELDRGSTAYVGPADVFNAGGTMRKIVTDFSNSPLDDTDTTARLMGRPAWEQGALLDLLVGKAGSVDAKGRVYGQLFEWQQTHARLWIRTSTGAQTLPIGTNGSAPSTASRNAGFTVAGQNSFFDGNSDASGFVHIVIREPWTGFKHTPEYTSRINEDLKWLSLRRSPTSGMSGGGGVVRSMGIGF